MLNLILIGLLLANSAFAAKISLDQRRKQIISIVDEELSEVSRLARQQDYKSPDTLLRISELNLEKARLFREAENEQYLAIPPAERRGVNKSSYFETSTKTFKEANTAALEVVKRFPNYKGIGDVYYILAYNNKELGNNEDAQKYFALSAEKSTPGSKISYKSKLALADYYFNENKFSKAIPLYEASISKVDEQWWTKDAFNLAWSYYRVKEYNKAISLMKEIHKKSSDNKYIDMRSLVERDIGIFFVDAGRLNDAISFYESLGINYTEQFVKIASAITTQGRFAQAESLLQQAANSEKNQAKRVVILLAQLDLFDKYDKIDSHLNVSKELVSIHSKNPLNSDDYKKLSYHINKKAAELQKATASDIYKSVPKVKQEKSRQSIAYFELSAQLNPGQKAEKIFFQGETAYASGDFAKAIGLYINAFDLAKLSNDKKIMGQCMDGSLSSLGQSSLGQKIAEKYYIPVYSRYLSFDSKSDKAHSIFVKLFNAQYDDKKISDAESTLSDFANNFPRDYKTQEGMLAKVMEYYREKKDYSKVKSYVSEINNGKFKVSSKYAEALRSLMTKIQIEGVQQSLEKGEKGAALTGYHQIYESSESTPKAKTNAAYNLSVLYYELGDANQSYNWAVKALKEMQVEDVVKFSDSYLTIAAGLFLRQHFSQSTDLSYRVLAKLCKQNSSNKTVAYKNSVFIALANNELDKAIEIKEFGKGCLIPDKSIAEVSLEILKDLAKAKRWDTYSSILMDLDKNSQNAPFLIKPYEDYRKELIGIGDLTEAKSIESKQVHYFEQAKQQKIEIPVEALDIMSDRILVSIHEKKKRFESVDLHFPENEFNNAVKLKLQLLDQITVDVNNVQKIGSGKGIVEAYKIVIESYENFAQNLKNFVPEGKSPEYVASFQKAMAEVYRPILTNAQKQRHEIKKLIFENKILSVSNYFVLYSGQDNFKRYVTDKAAVLMDRGGKK
ncbi:MAG: tetratricopeptide repeat protein [Bacteriovoracaceae bacterium]